MASNDNGKDRVSQTTRQEMWCVDVEGLVHLARFWNFAYQYAVAYGYHADRDPLWHEMLDRVREEKMDLGEAARQMMEFMRSIQPLLELGKKNDPNPKKPTVDGHGNA